MAELVKRIVTTKAELEELLYNLDFAISNEKIYWAAAGTTGCYWEFTNGELNFTTSEGNIAFSNNFTDFTNNKNAGVMFTYLADGGCILYITPLTTDKTLRDLNFNCSPTQGGLICVTPPEQDGYWRFVWRYEETNTYKWTVDNTHGLISNGIEIPYKQIIPISMAATLIKVYLENGYWSNNIYIQVLGQIEPPGIVFKINGQKFITFNDKSGSTQYRCPCFKLPLQEGSLNPSTSTQEYSPLLIYKPRDYCIYEGLLYRCIQGTNAGEGFDENKWVLTTVYQELNNG